MTPETEAQIRNVKKFGRYARQFCMLIGVVVGLSMPVSVASVLASGHWAGTRIRFGPYSVTGDHLTPPVQAWSILVSTLTFSILLWGVFHLYRLFRNLEAGEIYTKANVLHIRRVGLVAMAMAVVQILFPALTFALIEVGFIDRNLLTIANPADGNGGILVFGPGSFSGFVTAGLVLLVSWIMDVGRETSDEAAALRREADLVV